MPENITNEQLADLLTGLTATKENYEKITADFDAKLASVKTETTSEVAEKVADVAKKAMDAMTEYKKLETKFTEFVQKSERVLTNKQTRPETAGGQFVTDDAYKSYASKGFLGSARVRMKTLTNLTGAALIEPDQLSLVPQPEPALMIRDLIPKILTTKDSITYPFEKTPTNLAGGVSQGETKPTSNFDFDSKTVQIVTVAHLTKISLQMLDDVPYLRGFIDGRMAYLLKDSEDKQLLYGDGTAGKQLEGITTMATSYAVAMLAALSTTNATRIDELLAASAHASVTSKFQSTAYALYPMDWAKLLAVKDTTGRYILGNPDTEAVARLWDLPVVKSFNMVSGRFLTGAFNVASDIVDRQEANVVISTENSDDFEKNLATIRAEERIALLNYRPTAYVYGAFTVGA